MNLGFIGYWNISVDCFEGDNEEFIWEATVTQDGYRRWYFESDSLIDVAKSAIKWASDRMYIIDTEV